MEDPKVWIALAALVWTIVSVVGGWFIRAQGRRIDTFEDAVKELAKENAALRDAMANIKAIIGHTPTKDDFHQLALSVTELNGHQDTLNQMMKSLGSTVERIEGYLSGNNK